MGALSAVFVAAWLLVDDPVRVQDRERDAAWILLGKPEIGRDEVIVARFGAVRWSRDGDSVGDGGARAGFDRVRLADAGDGSRIRVAVSLAKLNLLVWIETADVAPQLQRTAVLRADIDAPPLGDDDGRIEIGPGELVQVTARERGWSRIETRSKIVGWIEDTALGPSFTQPPGRGSAIDDAVLHAGAHLHVRPDGARLHPATPDGATIFDEQAEPLRAVLVRRDDVRGWLLVEHSGPCRPGLRVTGWVRRPEVRRSGLRPRVVRCSPSTIELGLPARTGKHVYVGATLVEADRELLDADGEVVGRTRASVMLPRAPDGSLHVATPWGPLPVHVRPAHAPIRRSTI